MTAHRTLGLLLLSALALPSASQAYYVESRGLAGAEVPLAYADADDTSADVVDVNFRINPASFPAGSDAGAFTTAIQSAFATWTAAGCANVSFSDDGTSESVNNGHWAQDDTDDSGTIDPGEAHILVFFTDSPGEWTNASVGHFYFATNTEGVQIGGTVVLNSRDHVWATDGDSGSLDLQGTVTALIGRSLGISSNMEGNSTFPRYSPGSTDKQTLGADDEDAIGFLYPNGDAACDPVEPPEMTCLETTPDCPPSVTTNPGDGGTASPDAGPIPGSDAGPPPTPDAGPIAMPMSNGCSCRTTGQGSSKGGLVLLGLALGLAFMRRRRRRS